MPRLNRGECKASRFWGGEKEYLQRSRKRERRVDFDLRVQAGHKHHTESRYQGGYSVCAVYREQVLAPVDGFPRQGSQAAGEGVSESAAAAWGFRPQEGERISAPAVGWCWILTRTLPIKS